MCNLVFGCFRESFVHDMWRLSRVTLIPKKDGSLRPVSVTSLLAKLLEVLWLNEAQRFINGKGILGSFQVGFREREGVSGPISALDACMTSCVAR